MQSPRCLVDPEVVDQPAVITQGLRSNTCRAGEQVARLDSGDETTEGRCITPTAELESELPRAGPPLLDRERQEASVRQRLAELTQPKVPLRVCLARQRDHRIGPRPNLA